MVGNIGGRRGQFTQLFCTLAQEIYCVSHNTGVNRLATQRVSPRRFPRCNSRNLRGGGANSAFAPCQYKPPLPGPGVPGFGRGGAVSAFSVTAVAEGSSGIGGASVAVGAALSGGFGGTATSIAGPIGGSVRVTGGGSGETAGAVCDAAAAGGTAGGTDSAAGRSGGAGSPLGLGNAAAAGTGRAGIAAGGFGTAMIAAAGLSDTGSDAGIGIGAEAAGDATGAAAASGLGAIAAGAGVGTAGV
jgi:hypothetical protein